MRRAGYICGRGKRAGSGLGAVVAVVCLAAPALAEDLAVVAVRHWSTGETTRIAVEVTGGFQFRSDRLREPERIFFDLAGVRNRVSDKSLHVIPVADPILKQIRVAETTPGVTRVVLDLEIADVDFTASQLANPDRLMIELRARPGAPAAVSAATKPPPRPFHPPPPSSRLAETVIQIPEPPAVRAGRTRSSEPGAVRHESVITTAPPRSEPRPESRPAETTAATAPPVAPSKTMTAEKAGTAAPVAKTGAPVTEGASAAAPAKRNSAGTSSLTRALGLKIGRVMLDPGHGGHDTGTIGPSGLQEKDLVLDVARRLGELIEKKMGSEVVYTRNEDRFLALEERAEFANHKQADLFLSIHANSSPLKAVAGAETYYLSFTTSRAALEVAARENAGSLRTVHELQELLQKIALKEKVDESREFAIKVQSALAGIPGRGAARGRDRGVKKAPFVVLIGASMPAVLAEIGFVSNAREETLLKQGEYRQRIAEALFKGLSQYAQTLSHFQVASSGAL